MTAKTTMEKDGLTVKLTPPKEITKNKNKMTGMTYRILYLPKEKIDIVSEEAIEKCLDIIRKDITFYTIGKIYGT